MNSCKNNFFIFFYGEQKLIEKMNYEINIFIQQTEHKLYKLYILTTTFIILYIVLIPYTIINNLEIFLIPQTILAFLLSLYVWRAISIIFRLIQLTTMLTIFQFYLLDSKNR